MRQDALDTASQQEDVLHRRKELSTDSCIAMYAIFEPESSSAMPVDQRERGSAEGPRLSGRQAVGIGGGQ
jgi:hypothetical protein